MARAEEGRRDLSTLHRQLGLRPAEIDRLAIQKAEGMRGRKDMKVMRKKKAKLKGMSEMM